MVKIRLTRLGRKHKPFYRVVAIQAREKRDSKAIEYLGTYDPMKSPSEFKVDADRVKYWLETGAQPSDTVARLLAKEGLYKVEEKKFEKKPGKKKQARAGEEKAEESKEAPKKETVKKESTVEAEVKKEKKPEEEKKEEPAIEAPTEEPKEEKPVEEEKAAKEDK